MLFELHRAERSDTLADGLAALVTEPLADPFVAEIVSVPAKGVERWLTQRLSLALGVGARGHRDGIAANIVFPSPSRLVDDVVAGVTGVDPATDPWSPGPLIWSTLRVIDASLGEPWCGALARNLGADGGDPDDHRRGRRWSTAAHLTELFRSYAAQRPAMLVDWTAGRDTDGAGASLPTDLRWQAELWRRLRTSIGQPSPAERVEEVTAAVRRDPDAVDLPARLSLFGPTRLTSMQLAVFEALSVHRDVHLWLPHPSPALWTAGSGSRAGVRRAAAAPALSSGHPLLISLARDVREMQPALAAIATVDTEHPGPARPHTLLGRVQDDIAADRDPVSRPPVGLDDTVQVHACHGAPRQVEVLRESLLHLFQSDPTLEPRDVLVMCPDVETYAPLVRAAFGGVGDAAPTDLGVDRHPGHGLRVRMADRGLKRTNPVLAVLSAVIDLAGGRVTATQMLDLAASDAVRARFGFTDDDLERIREWTRTSGARWGISAAQRDAYGLGGFGQNTFNAALDRLLLGVAADESEGAWLDLALPVDDVDGNDIDVVGRYAELVDRTAVALHGMRGEHTCAQWAAHLRRTVDLLTDVAPADSWQYVDALRELAAAFEGGDEVVLRVADIRSMLRRRLDGKPTRSNFRTGELTVCTMVPMRSVPHRVVVLLGLDDDVFPRAGHLDGDDVLARDPVVGERDARSEDRQLLLDAVMAAGETLMLIYTGADPVSGTVRPPAIPLSELVDVLDRTAGESVVRRHPLQPFDPSNYDAARPFGFDRAALGGARATRVPSTPPPLFLAEPLPARPAGDVALADLVSFVQNPVTAFLRQRLSVRLTETDDDVQDALDVELDPLAKWNIGDRMLTALLAGQDVADFRAAEWRRGTLPPFARGRRQLEDIERGVTQIAAAAQAVHVGEPASLDIAVDLGNGRRLTGTVGGIHGRTLARTRYSKVGIKHRLESWVHLLAVAAHDDAANRDGAGVSAEPWSAATTGRGRGHRATWRSTLTAPDSASTLLRDLVELRDGGLREPLPMAPEATAAYADRRTRGVSEEMAHDAAATAFADTYGDHTDAGITLVHGTGAGFAALYGAGPADAGTSDAGTSDESTRFGALALRLWKPLLDNESQAQP